jgi:AcrR family transcriptional regulator
MNTLKDRQLQLREDAIIEAMRELMIDKGYAGTSMDDVAARLGISKATLYLHFKSKEELALRIIVRQIEDAEASLNALDPALPAIERLERELRGGIERRMHMGQARIDLLPDVVRANPDFQQAQARVSAANDRLLLEAQAQGDIRRDLPLPLLRAFISSTFSIPFEQLIRHDDLTREAVVNGLLALVLTALRGEEK